MPRLDCLLICTFFSSEYKTIKDLEQRRRYKSDFNADYAEYRDLHGIVEKVSRRFAQLEERLKQEDSSSPKYKVSLALFPHYLQQRLISIDYSFPEN